MPPTMAMRASHIIAYDGDGHRYVHNDVVVYEGDTMVYVGRRYDGPVDRTTVPQDRWRPPAASPIVHSPYIIQSERLKALRQRPPGL